MAIMGKKLGTNSRIDQPTCCALGHEPFFLRAADPFNYVDDSQNAVTYGGLAAGNIRVAYVDRRRKRMCRVYQISSTGCTSI
jgi:hypothetical protein